MITHFRQTVEVLDLIGLLDLDGVISTVRACTARNPGPAKLLAVSHIVTPVLGYLPARMVSDPAGYFVIYVDRGRRMLSLEHYLNDGMLDTVIEGDSAAELYTPAIDRGLVSRLDHAAYLGRELARAEESLGSGKPFIQEAAPELATPLTLASVACEPACHEAEV
jgi:tetrahydromethanopterin S-methyltransferase subunit A